MVAILVLVLGLAAEVANADFTFGTLTNLGPIVNSSDNEGSPHISIDGLSLYYCSFRGGGYGKNDSWVTTRETIDGPWGQPVNLGPLVNSSADEVSPCILADGCTLLFQSSRPGGYGRTDIWVTTRATTNEPWEEPVNLGPQVNSWVGEDSPSITPDGSTLFFRSNRPGGSGLFDIWQVPIVPVVDLNNDGIVDAADMCIMVDNWGTANSLCDIGPMPWGDGIVDVEDLKVLAEHLFEDVNDPTIVAHWPLDEAQGTIAYDNAADRDGTSMGGPLWQPDGGLVAGALQFDGIDDYVSTDFVLNPADGNFSVLAWIKGGASGQAVVSQANGVNWLCMDSVEGNLLTELTNPSRYPVGPMLSQVNVIDGDWHRIGFVWDGLYRHLYVDGVVVAIDATFLPGLRSAEGGLYLGADSTLAPGSFFSGLIDDVRIYDRAVTP